MKVQATVHGTLELFETLEIECPDTASSFDIQVLLKQEADRVFADIQLEGGLEMDIVVDDIEVQK